MKLTRSYTIDIDLWQKAKVVIPNLSEFIEESIRNRVYEQGDPKELKERINQLEKEMEMAKQGLTVAKEVESTELNEAMLALKDQWETRGEILEPTINYWIQKTGKSKDELMQSFYARVR